MRPKCETVLEAGCVVVHGVPSGCSGGGAGSFVVLRVYCAEWRLEVPRRFDFCALDTARERQQV